MSPPSETEEAAIAQSRMLTLGSSGTSGSVDVSPKGDPAGLLLQWIDGELYYPDRPGNRRIDSFRNILEEPGVALLAFLPGTQKALRLVGTARISENRVAREAFEVKGRVPALVTCISVAQMSLEDSQALRRASLWPVKDVPPDLRVADIFRDHVKLSGEKGLSANVARAAVSVPGMMKRSLESDYTKNLY
ncbi:MAG: pyridoxamine 5'-phosphate oxidase family protein [Pseudomonadota bacterium]